MKRKAVQFEIFERLCTDILFCVEVAVHGLTDFHHWSTALQQFVAILRTASTLSFSAATDGLIR
jgi:hypothetical protein